MVAAIPWYDAQTAVVGFVLALASLATAVGSFALRESLALRDLRSGALDPASAAGFGRLRFMLFVLWGLADLVGAFGVIMAWGSGDPGLVWPYVIGAAALFVLHAPRTWLFERRATAWCPPTRRCRSCPRFCARVCGCSGCRASWWSSAGWSPSR